MKVNNSQPRIIWSVGTQTDHTAHRMMAWPLARVGEIILLDHKVYIITRIEHNLDENVVIVFADIVP